MPLVPPTHDRFQEFCDLVTEYGDDDLAGSGFWGEHQPVLTRVGYSRWVDALLAEGDETAPSAPDRVKCSYFWITDEAGAWVGFIALRRSLNDFLLAVGGHIGYSVRPSRRREGHASGALAMVLREASALGIEQALITCDDDNLGSIRTIEAAGGVLEDVRGSKRRYWAPTASS